MRGMPRSQATVLALFKVILCLSVIIIFCGGALAMPSPAPTPVKLSSPPPGKVWVHFGESWILVSAPPVPGPYVWNGTVWVIDPTPPLREPSGFRDTGPLRGGCPVTGSPSARRLRVPCGFPVTGRTSGGFRATGRLRLQAGSGWRVTTLLVDAGSPDTGS